MGMCCHTEFANAVRLLTGHFSTGWQVHHAQFGHGKFDHLGIDPKGGRLFVAAESAHQVLVFGLKSGKYLRSIDEIEIPHAIFVREDLNRIFITDGGSGALKVYDAASYALLKSIPAEGRCGLNRLRSSDPLSLHRQWRLSSARFRPVPEERMDCWTRDSDAIL
jgi:hypothetical protein